MIKEPPSVEPGNFQLSRSAFLCGKNRPEAIYETNRGELASISESVKAGKEKLFERSNGARSGSSHEIIIKLEGINAVVGDAIDALNADEQVRSLQKGYIVFSRKLLQRNAAELEEATDAEGMSFNLLWSDFDYRYTNSFIVIWSIVPIGDFDHITVFQLKFNNSSF